MTNFALIVIFLRMLENTLISSSWWLSFFLIFLGEKGGPSCSGSFALGRLESKHGQLVDYCVPLKWIVLQYFDVMG